ncbi:hypothetical protein J1N35_025350 [Gossypium stocksii]|uniref:Uncharacterized protein n=1 Tax=Gossypium stocksii TaxID=47602 RepID=A0A9D3ZX26_9ROSI|nr:hypothetical protein J1N35_025350 [Gossypium stocksii]
MHTTRSKSFGCIADEEELSSGQQVRCLQLFDIIHRKKDRSPITTEAAEIMDKRVEYEAITTSGSPVNLDDIDNRIITEVLGPERLKDQMAQMQVSTVEQIAQLKVEVASREAEVQRKYEEFHLQLKAEAAERSCPLEAFMLKVAAFVGKAPLKVMFYSGVCEESAAKGHLLNGVCGKSITKGHVL